MLLIRIKTKSRGEKRKLFLTVKHGQVTADGNPYNVDPDCVFRTKLFPTLGMFGVQTIDYVEGNPNPVYYLAKDGAEIKSDMKPEVVTSMLRRLMKNVPKEVLYLTLVLSIVNTVLIFLVLDKLGGLA